MMSAMGAPRAHIRRTGLQCLALTLAALVAAFWIIKSSSWTWAEQAEGIVAVLALALTPTGLFLAWSTYAADHPADLSLARTTDLLAVAVRRQWEAEAQLRRLNDPHPLPVSWQAADADLVEERRFLEMTARGWPAGPHGDEADWASDLAGADAEITEAFARRVPTGRMVILGEPGSGKTMLLIRLVLGLLARRTSGDRVPVLVPLASWNPAEDDLHTWVLRRLTTDYPALKEPVSAESGATTRAQTLLEERRLLLVLDGLDEIPDAVRGASIAKINDALRPGEGVVLSCRTEQYHDAVHRPTNGAPVLLRGAAGITLQPLSGADVATYLCRDAGNGAAAARWDPVLARMGTEAPVARVLRTPLVVGLARTIYNPRPGEHAADLPDPAELCDTTRYPTPADVEGRLFDAFIPAAYRPHDQHPSRWTARRAERALLFLARHLDHTLHGTVDLAWWELPRAVPRYLTPIVSGLVSGIMFGLTSGISGGAATGALSKTPGDPWFLGLLALVLGTASGLIAGLVAAIRSDAGQAQTPATGIRWNWRRFRFGLAVGFLFGFAVGLPGELADGLILGLLFGFMIGLVGGLNRSPADLAATVGPTTLLAKDRNTFQMTILVGGLMFGLVLAPATVGGLMDGLGDWLERLPGLPEGLMIGLMFGLLFGLAGGLLGGRMGGLAEGLVYGLASGLAGGLLAGLVVGIAVGLAEGLVFGLAAGLMFGLTAGLVFGLIGLVGGVGTAAWGSFTVARVYLALRGRLPLRLVNFLADAHERRGVLRQVGAVYQFRHVELQRRLANRAAPTDADARPRSSALHGG